VKSTLHRALARLRQELESREAMSREATIREAQGSTAGNRAPAAGAPGRARVPAQLRGQADRRHEERGRERCAA
jgi:hypothetical protein